ncbi:antibiotic biosynthesis monooxygenase [Ascidiimonas sp. W6]|uniref:antibiotic biosynthesis monooxygenase family protein n=1 Tax=Ascidiimonas meishanensis TaxID=3128903 RepID=UPI0030ED7F5A
MIARIWQGTTKAIDYDSYTQFMKERAIPDYQETPGFIKLSFLRTIKNEIAHFTLITYWKNLDVIKNFAGDDFEKAKYYQEDNQYLLTFEETVQHFEVFADS